MFLFFLWQVIIVVQSILGYGTAYRLTKAGGDNGVSLFGWFIIVNFAALVPGLGIWMWFKYKDKEPPPISHSDQRAYDRLRQ